MIPVEEFWALVDQSLTDGSCLGVTLSKPHGTDEAIPERLTIRPTIVRRARVFQWASRRDNRETHENLTPEATGQRLRDLLGSSYADAHIFTTTADLEARSRPDGRLTVTRGLPTRAVSPLAHNRAKPYLIPENVPCRFLAEIGVMTPSGQVRAPMRAKFRQINRFLELVNSELDHLRPTGVLRVVDFGCGKSYLTFALHRLLTEIRQREVEMVGLDRDPGIIERCSQLTATLGCGGLQFRRGDIASQDISGPVDVVVSLHACDTATDDVLAEAVRLQAELILAVPCCQHELTGMLHVGGLRPLLRHGILQERFASMMTDGLRAQALEACGYKTQIVEFIDPEETPKNLLLRAVRREPDVPRDERERRLYRQLKETLGLTDIAADRIMAVKTS
jgi:SAM-dependent methyltransferase